MSGFHKQEHPPLIDGATVIRLERELDEQQKTVAPLRDDVNVLKLEYVGMQRDMNALAANAKADNTGLAEAFRSLSARFDESRKPNIPAIIGVFGLLPALAGGMFYIFNSNVSTALVPIEIRTSGYQQNQTLHDHEIAALQTSDASLQKELVLVQQRVAADSLIVAKHDSDLRRVLEEESRAKEFDQGSAADRAQLNIRVKHAEELLASGMADRLSNQARVTASLAEIETQFKDLTRYIVLLWEKTFRSRFPSDLTRENLTH